MFIALVALSLLLAALALFSASAKLRKDPQIIDSIHGTVGVPLRHIPVLAGLQVAGAAGIRLHPDLAG